MMPSVADLLGVLPEVIVMTAACLVLVLDPITTPARKDTLAWLSLAALAICCGITAAHLEGRTLLFSNLVIIDAYGGFWKLLLYVVTGLTILLSLAYMKEERLVLGEYYSFLLLLAVPLFVAEGALGHFADNIPLVIWVIAALVLFLALRYIKHPIARTAAVVAIAVLTVFIINSLLASLGWNIPGQWLSIIMQIAIFVIAAQAGIDACMHHGVGGVMRRTVDPACAEDDSQGAQSVIGTRPEAGRSPA